MVLNLQHEGLVGVCEDGVGGEDDEIGEYGEDDDIVFNCEIGRD